MVARWCLCYARKSFVIPGGWGTCDPLANGCSGSSGRMVPGGSTMPQIRARELASNRSAARHATRLIRAEHRARSRETVVQAQSFARPPAGVPVAAEFFAVDRDGYALVGSGIQLAVTPRGARATHGAGRLNEETA